MDPLLRSFLKMSEEIKVPEEVALMVREELSNKHVSEECMAEARQLKDHVPTYEEFTTHIKHLNPRSAGGPSGLTYLITQLWPEDFFFFFKRQTYLKVIQYTLRMETNCIEKVKEKTYLTCLKLPVSNSAHSTPQ